MTVGVMIVNDSGILVLESNRDVLSFLAKNSSPTGTVFVAQGASDTYAFGKPQTPSSYGFITKDASGNVLFDAVNYGKLAKPVGVMAGSIATVDTQTVSQTFAAGRTYAVWLHSPVSPLRPRNVDVVIGGNHNYYYALDSQEMTVSISGATISITATRTLDTNLNGGAQTVPYDGDGKVTWRAIVLDVTNY